MLFSHRVLAPETHNSIKLGATQHALHMWCSNPPTGNVRLPARRLALYAHMRLITPHVYPLFLFQYRVRYLLILKSGLYPERDSNPHPFGLGFEASAYCQFRHRGINRISAYTTHEENPKANVHAHIRLRVPGSVHIQCVGKVQRARR